MKRNINIILMAAMLGAVSCSKEAPFDSGDTGSGYGRVLTSALAVELAGEQTRATSDTPDVKDFIVEFCNTASTDAASISYKYSEMPEIVVLPAGVSYKAIAHYGDNEDAAWNAPYYYGESSEFDVVVDKIVDDLDPITCKLSNVKVSINFDSSLTARMGSDCKVNVRVGTSGDLTFTTSTQDYGYFAYVEGSNTLVATFTGTVDGDALTAIKTFDDVKAGVQYDITFRLTSPNAAGNGSISISDDGDTGISIEAAVTLADISGEIDLGTDSGLQEILLDDESERPTEVLDDSNTTEDPSQGEEPSEPTTSEGGPTVTPYWPDDEYGNPVEGTHLVDLNAVNNADGLVCAFSVDSSSASGFTQFEVDIVSDKLNDSELGQIGLAQHLDLAETPDTLEEALKGLGFPTNVMGMTHADFNITSFMPMLSVLGSDVEHKFILTISDENGTTVIELRIKC